MVFFISNNYKFIYVIYGVFKYFSIVLIIYSIFSLKNKCDVKDNIYNLFFKVLIFFFYVSVLFYFI